MLEQALGRLKDKPDKYPIVIASSAELFSGRLSNCSNPVVVKGSLLHQIYLLLLKKKEKAFTRKELSEELGRKVFSNALSDLNRKGLCHRLRGLPSKFGPRYMYSYSQKTLWKSVWSDTPKEIKKSVFFILKNPNMIFSQNDIMRLSGTTRADIHKWVHRFYNRSFERYFGFPLVQIRREKGLRTFYFSYQTTEQQYQRLFEKYYKDKILEERSLAKLKGTYFEDFCTWTFKEYLKLKGYNIEITKVDREPCDFVAKNILDISENYDDGKKHEIVLNRFILSCKNWRMDRPITGKYVVGMSGALSRGMAFNGDRIFTPNNCVGVIFCTKAYGRAWNMGAKQGILIFDLPKIMRMYKTVREKTGKEHEYFRSIKLKMEAYESKK